MSEMTNLAHELALNQAMGTLECETLSVDMDGQEWMDVDTDVDGVPLGIALKKEIRYLTLRGALCWHPQKPNLVRIVEVK
jgi:hypothetical protein